MKSKKLLLCSFFLLFLFQTKAQYTNELPQVDYPFVVDSLPTGKDTLLNLVVDTVGAVMDECNYNYALPTDTAYVSSVNYISNTMAEVVWTVKQGSFVSIYHPIYSIAKNGSTLVNLSLTCVVAGSGGTGMKVKTGFKCRN